MNAGCASLANFALYPGAERVLVEKYGIEAMVTAMNLYPDDYQIQYSATWAFGNLMSLQSENTRKRFVELGVINVCQRLLLNYTLSSIKFSKRARTVTKDIYCRQPIYKFHRNRIIDESEVLNQNDIDVIRSRAQSILCYLNVSSSGVILSK